SCARGPVTACRRTSRSAQPSCNKSWPTSCAPPWGRQAKCSGGAIPRLGCWRRPSCAGQRERNRRQVVPAVQATRFKPGRRAARGVRPYAVQGAYVNLLFGALPSVLAAVSECDPAIAREVGGYREGYSIGFAIL